MTSSRRDKAARRRGKQEKSAKNAPKAGAFEHLLVGILRRPHGVRGEMLLAVLTDFPERIQDGAVFLLGDDLQPVTVESVRQHNKGLLISFEEYPDLESLGFLRNVSLFVRVDDRPPLPEGEYYQHQLLGLDVVTDEGIVLGVVIGFIQTGANDVYRVLAEDGKEVLLPAIDDVILDIDVPNQRITVHLLDGLLD
jgi:16S rRNA processing protein RimM